MAGLLAWAADVVGGSGQGGEEDEQYGSLPLVFSPEQQQRAIELDRLAESLRRSIQDLRLRIPPPNIAQRLPHLHAHSVASNAALALQLNAHSTTREQAQQREVTLQEENAAYEKAISTCQKKIQEKLHEADQLRSKLKEMDLIEKDLKAELEKAQVAWESSQLEASAADSDHTENSLLEREHSKSVKREELENKKRELGSIEEMVQRLENEWSFVHQDSIKQPSPAQREKILEKHLHSLIEQLTSKQAQAEGLITEIRAKEKELEQLNGLQRTLGGGSTDPNPARNRIGRSLAGSGTSADYTVEAYRRPYHISGIAESQHRLVLLRSAFVLYIFALHIIVFIKISV